MRNLLRRHGAFIAGIILGVLVCYGALTPTMRAQSKRNRDLTTALEERVVEEPERSIVNQLNHEGVDSWPAPETEEVAR